MEFYFYNYLWNSYSFVETNCQFSIFVYVSSIQKTQKAEDEPWQKADLEELKLIGVEPTADPEKYCCKRITLGEYGRNFFLET